MDNLTVAMVAAGIAGALGAWAVVRGALGVRDEVEQQSPTSGGARALLAVPGAFFLRRREKDRELARKLAPIFTPGEIEWGKHAKADAEGLELPADVEASLRGLAQESGIALPVEE